MATPTLTSREELNPEEGVHLVRGELQFVDWLLLWLELYDQVPQPSTAKSRVELSA